MDNRDRNFLIGIVAACAILVLCCCCACVLLSVGSIWLSDNTGNEDIWATYSSDSWTPVATVPEVFWATPMPLSTPNAPTHGPGELPTPQANPTTVAYQSGAEETLHTLEDALVPVNEPLELAYRLKGLEKGLAALEAPLKAYAVGDEDSFEVINGDNDEYFTVNARLVYMAEHVYFWVEKGVEYDQSDVKRLVDTFDKEIYPRNREFFGSEWTPGVDADPRLFILYARSLGGAIAGYFSSSDSYMPQVKDHSNMHEMFMLSADHVSLDEQFAYGVLAHEFQHMIHWYRDRNEETWMNEGFSELAMLLNDYDVGGSDRTYAYEPDLNLTDWPDIPDKTPHYGAAFMFVTYFLDRFGEQATKALVSNPENGMVSIDQVMADLEATAPDTGEPIGADDLFADFAVALYLQDSDLENGRYNFNNYPAAPDPDVTETVTKCPLAVENRDVHQYGVDYIQIKCRGDYLLRFAAPVMVGALPGDPHSGQYAFYSNRGDESDMTLTRTFDFTAVSGEITMSYWTWYDLEQDYDYVYLLASEDGERWEFIHTPSGTASSPTGGNYGWGYTGVSGGKGGGSQWIEESVDLSQYAGKQVQIRFEYVTDAAMNGEGLLLDDVSIPAIGYSTDFEQDHGGWEAAGFVRIQNILPQSFRLSLIYQGKNPRVEKLVLPSDNILDIPLTIGGDTEAVILVVSGATRFTRQKAFYQFAIQPR